MKTNCDITYKEMNVLIKHQDRIQINNLGIRNNKYRRCSAKFRKDQNKDHIVPISLRGLVCDISKSECMSFSDNHDRTRSISIRGEDGLLYNYITSYKKRIGEFEESMNIKKDIIINAYINNRQSNNTVKKLCSAGHSGNVTVDILHSEESIIENS